MSALAGVALLCEGSTTTQGKYAATIRKSVDYLAGRSNRKTGLIGNAEQDGNYTYGHGFSMLFLSQVLGEEEDAERRLALIDVLTRAVKFSGDAQTPCGGWGYISSKDSGGFDEGSTTITQVQGLRGCRNAGIPVPKDISTEPLNISTPAPTRKAAWPIVGFAQPRPGPAGHLGGSHRLPVQCRRLRRQVRPQNDGVLPWPL